MNINSKIMPEIAQLILNTPPAAIAQIRGSAEYPDIVGNTAFYPGDEGVLVVTAVTGLPEPKSKCDGTVHAMHIHSGSDCSGNASDPFANAGEHYNPENCPHPQHAGDLPPIFANNGSAWNAVLTDRFDIEDILGKTVIIHASYDDFMTQPSGNSGAKIACGVIRPM